MNKKLLLIALATSIAMRCAAQVYTLSGASAAGDSNSNTYGVTFTPSVPVTISDLGAFVYGTYTSGDISISIWKQGDTVALSTTTLHIAQAQNYNGFNFVFENADLGGSFAPVNLSAGIRYAVVLTPSGGTFYRAPGTYTTQDPTASGINLDGLFNPGSVYTTNPLSTTISTYSTPAGGVNFVVAPTPVPEPSDLAAGAALGLAAFAAWRKVRG
jgi:hypothetical protein